jgi:large subunit ribosomal protein L21
MRRYTSVYAIVETGGKQYRVNEGDYLDVEKLQPDEEGMVCLDKVLVLSTDEGVKVGTPYLEGVRVMAKVIKQDKGPKIIGFKYKAKENYRRRYGHRQPYSNIRIEKIEA